MPVLTNPWLYPFIPIPPAGIIAYEAWFSTALAVQLQTREKGFPKHKPSWPTSITTRDLLLCAGLAMSPAVSADDRRAWAFLIEHGPSIEPRAGTLRIVDDSETWDARVRGLFAERIGVGVAAWHLWHTYDVVHIADIGPFLSKSLVDRTNPYYQKHAVITGKHGALRPDFLCLTSSLEAVLAESKGAFGAPSAISAAERKKAKQQLENVAPVGVALRSAANRLAFATNLRTTSEHVKTLASDTGVSVEDPEGREQPLTFNVSPDQVVIEAYAKLLNFLGLGFVGYLLRIGIRPIIDANELEERIETVRGEPIFLLQTLFGHRFGLPHKLAITLFNLPVEGVAGRVSALLGESPLFAQQEADGAFVLPNGLVALADY